MNTPQVVKENELIIVGYRVLCEGDEYSLEIPKAAKSLKMNLEKISNAVSPPQQIGAFMVEENSPDEDGYWLGVRVSDSSFVPEGMETKTIPEQTYAVTLHKGSNLVIRETYEKLHRWIEDKGYIRLKNSWHLERYLNWGDPDDLEVELLETIQPQDQ
ncbi:GyrI-like domain-containing protein [Jeotgalibacillus proteolyticus]|uniref:AraC family transcriptional regulator n=1 Tax=Jeotgalibacillus proteolyticus TaxID=2082395 RepID=A0A2S5GCG8_9BACL|nr:GyrI-like domain-containing protein [Jeotgalibacillus proteolyticus]PPA70700.1 AraC family transcriptional regulator [Jeotgalibacillus proteolyticus]